MLKPQDIVVLLKTLSMTTLGKGDRTEEITQTKLAVHLCMSVSEVNAATKRLHLARITGYVPLAEGSNKKVMRVIKSACEECLIYGVKYFFPARLGGSTSGIATSYAE